MDKLKSPAHKNMTREQLEDSIKMGKAILNGDADLVELDNKSLELRGKQKGSAPGGKRKRKDVGDNAEVTEKDSKKQRSSPKKEVEDEEQEESASTERSPHFPTSPKIDEITKDGNEDLKPWLKKIALSNKTPFQKKVLTALCQVPQGQYTTYGAISKHLSSAPRAVGNALRNNPFAPQVPCHRVLATGGGLGGFMGSWGKKGEAGKNDDKKLKLLRAEGVKFDGHGRVVGKVWDNFK
ncbi:6-O-methylguanine DNA methyltransferase [Halenospora varia]|nr:6-O-methylguanine DNA methyltransferase [Halenospora varia]